MVVLQAAGEDYLAQVQSPCDALNLQLSGHIGPAAKPLFMSTVLCASQEVPINDVNLLKVNLPVWSELI